MLCVPKMKIITLLAAFLMLSGYSSAAQKSDDKAGQSKVTGTVTHYAVAKSIEIDANGVAHKYDLNDSDIVYSIGPEVAEGSAVTVTETTNAEGHKTISIGPRAPKA